MRRRRWPKVLGIVLGSVAAVVALVVVAFQVSPWPSVLLLHAVGDDGMGTARGNEAYVPAGIHSDLDLVYHDGMTLDVFRPASVSGPLPTIVWVHGGGFIGGIKAPLRPYLKILASHGFTTVNVEYTHAPEATYPTPVKQLSAALEYVRAHAGELGVDADQIVLGGDSAGAHIAGQTALAISDARYAADADLPRAIPATALRGAALFSGPFDLRLTNPESRQMAWFLNTVLWAYTGTKDFRTDPALASVSLPEHVTSSYPPTFLSTGPADPLLSHSESMAKALAAHGVDVTTLFFDPATTPDTVGHEYALALDTPQGKRAMVQLVAYLRRVTDGPEPPGVSADW